MHKYEIGKPWPHPYPVSRGMQALAEPGEEGLALMLLVGIPSPTAPEVRAVKSGRIRIGVLPAPPLAWLVLSVHPLGLDAPYALGLHEAPRRTSLLASARLADAWAEAQRGLITVALADTDTRIIRGLRVISLTRAWWQTFGAAIAACEAPLRRPEHESAIARDYAKWRNPAEMLAACAAVEVGGL